MLIRWLQVCQNVVAEMSVAKMSSPTDACEATWSNSNNSCPSFEKSNLVRGIRKCCNLVAPQPSLRKGLTHSMSQMQRQNCFVVIHLF